MICNNVIQILVSFALATKDISLSE